MNRWSATLVAALVAAGLGTAAPAASATSDVAGAATAQVEAAVTADLAGDGRADFFLRFAERADLTAAAAVTDRDRRGHAVVDALRATADRSQAAALGVLTAAGAEHQAFWASNTVLVRGGTPELAAKLGATAGVRALVAHRSRPAPVVTDAAEGPSVATVEWGIAAINADDVWAGHGVRGEGIVVAGIDTGVSHTHPALAGSYRGNPGGGVVDHDHDWFDPAGVCPSAAPCDNNGHGTHTMGTMVGDDGAGNQIGVAPGARWIAAKGCEGFGCSDASLLAAGQWMLAPTRLDGTDPRPELRPHVINNSWGGGGGDTWYDDVLTAWRASGIAAAFSVGGSGPACGGVGSPADRPDAYAAAAHDVNGLVSSFSARGPASDGRTKPDITAPGVGVRSSVGAGYAVYSGTSMATAHTSGALALVMSAAPAIARDVDEVLRLVDDGAVDVADLTCGGTADDNNVYGEGRLDVLAAVAAAPRGDTGTLAGTVTSRRDGTRLAGARVRLTGAAERTVLTGADGSYRATLPVGAYTVTADAFGHATGGGTATVVEDATTTLDVRLRATPAHRVRGTVRDADGAPVAGATVTLPDTPLPAATTGDDGRYSFAAVPRGTYRVTATGGRCTTPDTRPLTVHGTERFDLTLGALTDAHGHTCVVEPGGYVEGDTPLALTGDDAALAVPLPFAFPFHGASYRQAFVSTNGHLNFLAASSALANGPLPSAGAPNAALYPFWDDLLVTGTARMYTRTAPGSFLVEWRDAGLYGLAPTVRVDFSVELRADGGMAFRYRGLDPQQPRELGSSATVGIENATGTDALTFSVNTAALADATVRIRPPAA
ncbi:MAG TPA: S8 family serine peptidase [Pseudonocardiaceae bacterium]